MTGEEIAADYLLVKLTRDVIADPENEPAPLAGLRQVLERSLKERGGRLVYLLEGRDADGDRRGCMSFGTIEMARRHRNLFLEQQHASDGTAQAFMLIDPILHYDV